MDIENLKGSWKKYAYNLSNQDYKDEEELKRILVKRSQRSLKLLRRNFLIEAGLNVLLVPLIIVLVLNTEIIDGVFRTYFASFIVAILLLFMYYMYHSYRKIYQYENHGLQIKDKLQRQIRKIENFIKYYFRFLYISYFLGLIFGLSLEMEGDALSILLELGGGLVFGVILLFLVLRPFARLYVKKLYGVHLDSLKACLSEFDDNNNENMQEND